MSASHSAIATERKGYGRGLILGLTMAETFMLLVFCLLLVAAAAIAAQRREASGALAARDAAQNEALALRRERNELARRNANLATTNSRLMEANARLETVIEAMPQPAAGAPEIPENWRELVFVKDVATTLSEAGVAPAEIKALAPTLAVLKEKGFLTAGAPVAERLEGIFERAESAATQQPHQWPPIINLSEAGGYYFAVGSAELTEKFAKNLQGPVAHRIDAYLKQYQVDVVEVIGHTDEQPLAGASSNLDRDMRKVLSGDLSVTGLKPADNAGLGFARALAVANALRASPLLAKATILPLSGAQLIQPGDRLSDGRELGDVESRRRIEIRVRRRSDPVTATAAPPAAE